jgi:RsiW-degrading membrane proteinase PrsW (M82 family)
MPEVGSIFSNSPLTFLVALLGGIIPAVLWLMFWLREDDRKESTGLLIITFLTGMLAVVFVLPIEKFISTLSTNQMLLTTLWAASEEVVKYLAFAVILTRSPYLDEPIDYAIYFMTAALGFAAFENALFLIHPLATSETTVSFLTGNLRFLGATLLHSVTSGIVGVSLGLAYFKSHTDKKMYWLGGMICAIALHAIFNFFIIQKNGENFFQVFGFLWVITIIIMLLFEKLRRMGKYVEDVAPVPSV